MHADKSANICSKTRSGDSWLKQVLHHVWLHLHLAWKLRNADLCSIDKADEELKREAKLRPKIVAPCLDKHLFASDLDKRLDDTGSSEQTAWINLVTPTVRQAKAEADDHLSKSQQDIVNVFDRFNRSTTSRGPAQTASNAWTPRRLACFLHFASAIALSCEPLSSHFQRPHCDSACNSTGVGRLFLGGGAGEARQRKTDLSCYYRTTKQVI
jgi:hypothetical protein